MIKKLAFDIFLETQEDLKLIKTVYFLNEARDYCFKKNNRIPNVKNDEYYYFLSREREYNEK